MPKSKAKWTIECQEPWEMIKTWYMDGPILITFHWDLKFNVHTNASNLVVRTMLACKCDWSINYPLRFINNVK